MPKKCYHQAWVMEDRHSAMAQYLKNWKRYVPFLCAFLGGAIMVCAFAPYYIEEASVASCLILLASIAHRNAKTGFLLGFVYGLGLFGFGVSWIYVSIHLYGQAAPPLAASITALFIVVLACFPACLAGLLNRAFPENNLTRCVLAFPALWVLLEGLRGWLFTGFPWLFIGYSQITHLREFAPLGGVYAVSWATVLMSGLLYLLMDYYYSNKKHTLYRNSLFVSILFLWGTAYWLHQVQWVKETDEKLSVALVQGNIAQKLRWDPQALTQILSTYQLLTQSALQKHVDLIVWPEGAIPLPLPHATAFFSNVAQSMNAQRTALFSGIPIELPQQAYYYNALIGVGEASGQYYKRKLVPFGEYVPFEKYLRGLIAFFDLPMSSFVPGPAHQALLSAQGFAFAPAICYEIAYPHFVQTMSKKADFILTVSNDAWFGRSVGPAQHLQIAQFRALENGKYVIRSTNTGFTAIINPRGKIVALAPQFESTLLYGTVSTTQGHTPWSRYGIGPVLLALLTLLSLAFVLQRYRKVS